MFFFFSKNDSYARRHILFKILHRLINHAFMVIFLDDQLNLVYSSTPFEERGKRVRDTSFFPKYLEVRVKDKFD